MSSFIDAFREARNSAKADKDEADSFNQSLDSVAEKYAKSRNISKEDAINKITGLVKKAGEYDGTLNADSSDGDIARYGNKFLNDMGYEDMEMGFNDYIRKYGSEKQKKALEKLEKYEESKSSKSGAFWSGVQSPSRTLWNLISGQKPGEKDINNPIDWYTNVKDQIRKAPLDQAISYNQARARDKAKQTLDESYGTYEDAVRMSEDDFFSALDDSDSIIERMGAKNKANDASGKSADGTNKTEGTSVGGGDAIDPDTITFTLPRANDPNYRGFGAKLQELGLTTDKGLWGSGGDVEFYTQQLYDQGALDSRGNLKIGVPITLRRRK